MNKSQAEIYGKNILTMIFFNEKLQKDFLPVILPGFFVTSQQKLIAYSMKLLSEKKAKISVESILIIQRSRQIHTFLRKIKPLKSDKVELSSDILGAFFYDIDVVNEPELFNEVWRSFHDYIFSRKTKGFLFEMSTHLDYGRPRHLLPYLDAIKKLHRLVYTKKYAKADTQIRDTAVRVNTSLKSIPMSSKILTSLCGGWTRGFPSALLARASHAKSTLMTYESLWLLNKGYVESVDIILCEEDASALWSRVFSYECNIPSTALRERTVEVTEEQIKKVEDKYKGRLRVHDGLLKYEHVVDLLYTLRGQFIWIDHLNVIQYPGGSDSIRNQIGGIPNLITQEKEFLKNNKDKVIVNLSQPNEKKIKERRTHWKMPEYTDAYASSILHQACREFLVGYYPYKDAVESPASWTGKKEPCSNRDYYVNVAKSSYGDVGQVRFDFDFEFGRFKEMSDRKPELVITDNMFENFTTEKL
jgi:hypothetical protein